MVIAVQTKEISSIADSRSEKIESNISQSVPKKIKSVGEKQAHSSDLSTRNVRLNSMVVPTICPRDAFGGDLSPYNCPECDTQLEYGEYYDDFKPDQSKLGLLCPKCKYEELP